MKKLFLITFIAITMTSCFKKDDPVAITQKERKLDSLITIYNTKLIPTLDEKDSLVYYGNIEIPKDGTITLLISNNSIKVYK